MITQKQKMRTIKVMSEIKFLEQYAKDRIIKPWTARAKN